MKAHFSILVFALLALSAVATGTGNYIDARGQIASDLNRALVCAVAEDGRSWVNNDTIRVCKQLNTASSSIAAMMIHLPWKRYLRESSFFIVLAAIMWLSAYCHSSDFISSAASAVAFLAMVLASVLLTDTTMPDELSRSFGKALSHIIGKYAYVLSAVMEITLSMIPIIIDSALGMLEARKARGASLSRHPFREVCQISISILSDILDKAEIYADALYSRGYDVSASRCTASYSFGDCFLIVCGIVSFPILYFYIH